MSQDAESTVAEATRNADVVCPANDVTTGAPLAPHLSPWAWRAAQRALALAGLILAAPLLAVLFVAIRLESCGPAVVRQRREGFLGIPFEMFKLRVSRPDPAHPDGGHVPTRLGPLLRSLKLDELPQLWNIVRGDLEFVGPRPLPLPVADRLAAANPEYAVRLSVMPGLTNVGPVSVVYDEDRLDTLPDTDLLFEAERHYVRFKSVSYDVVLIALTGLFVLRRAAGSLVRPIRVRRARAAAAPRPGAEIAEQIDGWLRASGEDLEPKLSSLPWRVTQRLVAAVALVALAPLFAAMYAAVKLTSRGPFLFKQVRPGFLGRPFRIYKVRTMTMGAEARTALGVQNSDPTVTRPGRVFRALKLDELPQLWNVVKGDMELVGPRPIPIALEAELIKHIPDFATRHLVKPGLTNAAQISVVDNELSDRLIRDWTIRAEAERHYVAHKSIAYDVVMVVMTTLYILRKLLRRGAAPAPAGGVPVSLVLGTPICNLDYDGVLDRAAGWIDAGEPSRYVCIAPVHSVIEARLHEDHRRHLAEADLNTADGMPVVWAQRLLGHAEASRVYGPTLMLKALERANENGWRVAFYGGHPERLEVLLERLRERFPRLQVVFHESPPFRTLTEEEDADVVERLNDAKPDLVWVGLGCPKQERWMHEHRGRVRGVMFGVGAAFDFHAGAVRQAPPTLQRLGLEWAFRLACEPRRLFRRYATTNPIFLWLFGWQLAQHTLLRRRYQSRQLTARAS